MIQIRKTLYITEEDFFLHCTDSALEVRKKEEIIARIPPTAIEQIVFLTKATISSYLVKWCNDNEIRISYISQYGVYYGRMEGTTSGNVVLRRRQYQLLDTPKSIKLVQNILLAKFSNSVSVIKGMIKNSSEEDRAALEVAIDNIKRVSKDLYGLDNIDSLRGMEGQVAVIYYSVFDNMLKSKSENMKFKERSKRPPENNINALLSLLYTLETRDCVSAIESNGLDSYCGYLHTLRSGRESLACDLVEEFRAKIVDRFVIKNVNLSKINEKDFENINGHIKLKDESRKKVLMLWSEYKDENIDYPYEKKSYPIKLIPHLQARLLAEYIRGDIEEYPPWVA